MTADFHTNMAAYQWLATMVVMRVARLGLAMVETVFVTLVWLWLAPVTTNDLFQFVIAEFLYHKILIH